MMSFKTMLYCLFLGLSLPVFAVLEPDLHCEAKLDKKVPLELKISDMDFVREVEVRVQGKTCKFNIELASYSERSAAPVMIFELTSQKCPSSKKMSFLKNGFVKINVQNGEAKAHALVLVGHDTLDCKVKSFNKRKLQDRIRNDYQ